MMHKLYRHFDASGVLLYVGISLNVPARLAGHRTFSKWFDQIAMITVENFETRREASIAEIKAIETENPQFNVNHGQSPRDPHGIIGFPEVARILGVRVGQVRAHVGWGKFPIMPHFTKPNKWMRVIIEKNVDELRNFILNNTADKK